MTAQPGTLALSIAWWAMLILLGPLLWAQGRWARWRTPRLAPPPDPLQGHIGEDHEPFRILVLGESPAAGIGVSTREESLPAQLALELGRRKRLPVKWRSVAVNGSTIRDVIDRQLPQIQGERADLVVVVIGVNDTTGLTSRSRWRRGIIHLINRIRDVTPASILFASLPRMESFTAMPQPLRAVIGIRARLLDQDLGTIVTMHDGVTVAGPLQPLTAAQLAADGYHPSALACTEWAIQLANRLHPSEETRH